MHIEFSTTIPEEARRRIMQADPSISAERLERIVQAVKDGYIRVGDPMMYPNGIPITPTPKGETIREKLVKILS